MDSYTQGEQKVRTGVMLPQVKEPPEAGREDRTDPFLKRVGPYQHLDLDFSPSELWVNSCCLIHSGGEEDGSNIGGSGVHFPSTPGKYLADLRSRANSQQYSSIYEDQRPKIEDIERSDGKKSA